MSAIQATSAGVRDMADGSLRITLEFDPPHAKEAYALFGARGTSCAVAALTQEASQQGAQRETVAQNERPGQLCVMACTFCADPMFWKWLSTETSADEVLDEAGAKEFILCMCGIDSRKKLDQFASAARTFHEQIRQPFVKWKADQDARRVA